MKTFSEFIEEEPNLKVAAKRSKKDLAKESKISARVKELQARGKKKYKSRNLRTVTTLIGVKG